MEAEAVMLLNTIKNNTMKKISQITKKSSLLLCLLAFFAANVQLYAEITPAKVDKEFNISGFTGIESGSNFNVVLIPSENEGVTINVDEAFIGNVRVVLKGSTLVLDYEGKISPKELNAKVRYKDLRLIKAHGASVISSEQPVKAGTLTLESSGAARIDLEIEAEEVKSNTSGAAETKLHGECGTHIINVSGAGDLMAKGLITSKAEATISGAGNASVDVRDQLNADLSGSGNISYIQEPTIKAISKTGNSGRRHSNDRHKVNIGNTITVQTSDYYDSTNVKVGGIEVQVLDDDSVKVSIGRHQIIVDEDGNVDFRRRVRKSFNGHWGGFGLGINGYVNSDLNMDFPQEYGYMDLYMAKSISVNLNLIEHNFQLSKNGKWGIITGLGLEWHNYRFDKNVTLIPDSSTLKGYYNDGARFEKYKLVVNHLVIPLIFEYQTHALRRVNDFHVGVGAIFGIRYSSHTKRKFDERNKDYNLLDPVSGKVVATATTPDTRVGKVHDDFHLAPFKLDATLTVGWGFVNLYGTFSMFEMFKKNKGPELYPYTIGIMLVGW